MVDGALLPKTLIDGGSSLNIIFVVTPKKMKFNFSKMTACDEPFYGVVPGKVAYPLGRVCLPVTFGTLQNYRTEYLTFEVADFASSYHAILGRPKIDATTIEVPEQKRTPTALDTSPATKKVCLGLPDAEKTVVIGADLDPK